MYKPLQPEDELNRQKYLIDVIAAPGGAGVVSYSLGLPFFHTCKGKRFRDIFTSRCIAPRLCPEFGEQLSYFFYGKPTYRLSGGQVTSKDHGKFPVSFVVQLSETDPIPRVFPFDSGALIHDMLSDVCGDERNPAKFELGPGLEKVKQFVSYLYGSDEAYFYTKPQINEKDVNGMSFELHQILMLATEKSDKKWDNRAYTVEVQCATSIELSGYKVKAILLPSSFLNTSEVADYLYNNNIEAIPYFADRGDPQDAATVLITLAEQYLKRMRAL